MSGPSQIELVSPPTDGITGLAFVPSETSHHLLSSSWDCMLRLHDTDENALIECCEFQSPVLSCGWYSDTQSLAGSLDGSVSLIDWAQGAVTVLGSHTEDSGVATVTAHSHTGAIISSSWDGSINIYDLSSQQPLIHRDDTHTGTGVKCYSHSVSDGGYELIVASSNNELWLYDLRKMQRQTLSSPLQHQLRCVRMTPRCFAPQYQSSVGYTVASIEGRIACQYLIESANYQPYAFKCHRQPIKDSSSMTAYPVNALAYHPVYGTFASGGCDGIVNVWDGVAKKRVCQYAAYESSIAALEFSMDGERLAVASSYTWERGEQAAMAGKDKIFVRRVSAQEVKPRSIK